MDRDQLIQAIESGAKIYRYDDGTVGKFSDIERWATADGHDVSTPELLADYIVADDEAEKARVYTPEEQALLKSLGLK